MCRKGEGGKRKLKGGPEGQWHRQEAKKADLLSLSPWPVTRLSLPPPPARHLPGTLLQQPAKQVNTQRAVYPHSCCTLSFHKEKASCFPPGAGLYLFLIFNTWNLVGPSQHQMVQVDGAGGWNISPHLCQLKKQSPGLLGKVCLTQSHSSTTLTAIVPRAARPGG